LKVYIQTSNVVFVSSDEQEKKKGETRDDDYSEGKSDSPHSISSNPDRVEVDQFHDARSPICALVTVYQKCQGCDAMIEQPSIICAKCLAKVKRARAMRMMSEAIREYHEKDSCPGCGCKAGDGITDDCNDASGCGHFKQLRAEYEGGAA